MYPITARVHHRGGDLPKALLTHTVSSENVCEVATLLPYLHAIANDPLITRNRQTTWALSPTAVILSDHVPGIEMAERVLFDNTGAINWHLDQALLEHGYYLYTCGYTHSVCLQLPNCRLILTNPY